MRMPYILISLYITRSALDSKFYRPNVCIPDDKKSILVFYIVMLKFPFLCLHTTCITIIDSSYYHRGMLRYKGSNKGEDSFHFKELKRTGKFASELKSSIKCQGVQGKAACVGSVLLHLEEAYTTPRKLKVQITCDIRMLGYMMVVRWQNQILNGVEW